MQAIPIDHFPIPVNTTDKPEANYLKLARLGGYVGEQARAKLIQRNYSWIIQRCTQTLQSHADAHDAAQEVVLRMHKSLPSFEGRSSLRTWLNSIIHNECVNLVRRQQRTALSSQFAALIAIHESDSQTSDAGDHGMSDENSALTVHQALKALPAADREVLHLRFFGELPIAEISTLLGISLSAAKMRLYRALDAFKERYIEGQPGF